MLPLLREPSSLAGEVWIQWSGWSTVTVRWLHLCCGVYSAGWGYFCLDMMVQESPVLQ